MASYEIASNVNQNCCGFIFGFNTFLALVFQTILTITVVDDIGLALCPRNQVKRSYVSHEYVLESALPSSYFISTISSLLMDTAGWLLVWSFYHCLHQAASDKKVGISYGRHLKTMVFGFQVKNPEENIFLSAFLCLNSS